MKLQSRNVCLSICYFLIAMLHTSSLAIHVIFWRTDTPFRGSKAVDHNPSFLGHDFPSSLPLPPSRSPSDRVLLPVQETVHYSLSGDASDNEWSNLTSAGFGYAHLGPDSRLFMVRMFHELHCLRVLNFAFDRSHKATGDHVHHCLNYLRQMALCSADVTLEPGDFTKRNFEGSRTGSVHVCRDWSALYDAMEENWVQWEDVDGDDTSPRTAASL